MCITLDCDGGSPIPCLVQNLLKNHFCRESLKNKKIIVRCGRQAPHLDIKQEIKDKGKVYIRSFKSVMYYNNPWLTGCSTSNKLYCWPCLLFNKEMSPWNTSGYSDLKNFSNAKMKHLNTKCHRNAESDLNEFISLKIKEDLDPQCQRRKDVHNAITHLNLRSQATGSKTNERVCGKKMSNSSQLDIIPASNGESSATQQDPASQPRAEETHTMSFNNDNVPDFKQFLLSEKFTDVFLVCKGKRLSAHRSRLSSVSPFLASIFTADTSEISILILPDIKYETMRILLYFIYTGFTTATEVEVREVLAAGNLLGIKEAINVEVSCMSINQNLPPPTSISRKRQADTRSSKKDAASKKSKLLKTVPIQTVIICEGMNTLSSENSDPGEVCQPTMDPLDVPDMYNDLARKIEKEKDQHLTKEIRVLLRDENQPKKSPVVNAPAKKKLNQMLPPLSIPREKKTTNKTQQPTQTDDTPAKHIIGPTWTTGPIISSVFSVGDQILEEENYSASKQKDPKSSCNPETSPKVSSPNSLLPLVQAEVYNSDGNTNSSVEPVESSDVAFTQDISLKPLFFLQDEPNENSKEPDSDVYTKLDESDNVSDPNTNVALVSPLNSEKTPTSESLSRNTYLSLSGVFDTKEDVLNERSNSLPRINVITREEKEIIENEIATQLQIMGTNDYDPLAEPSQYPIDHGQKYVSTPGVESITLKNEYSGIEEQ